MYGIVNQAIQGLVVERFGREKWEEIKRKCRLDLDYFISNDLYDDEITYELVGGAAEVLDLTSEQVLNAFGEYWVLKTGYEKYGDLMKAGGSNLYEFICNLPNFHGRIMLIYPNISPPEFMVEKISPYELYLHYYSSRNGLTQFVVGLIHGLAKMFGETVEVFWTEGDYNDVWHDVFHISVGKKD